jgi:hypothetical protein
MSATVRATEAIGLAATIDSKNGTGSYYSDAISLDADAGRRFVAYVNVGTIGSSATVDFEFQWSATSGGTYATVTGAKITQDTAGSLTHRVEVTADQVKAAFPTATYMKGYLKTLVAATPTGVVVTAHDQAHMPAVSNAAHAGQTVATVS